METQKYAGSDDYFDVATTTTTMTEVPCPQHPADVKLHGPDLKPPNSLRKKLNTTEKCFK